MTSIQCPHCRSEVSGGAETCPECGDVIANSTERQEHGAPAAMSQRRPQKTSGMAIASLICSIAGFFFCFLVPHILGIVMGVMARKKIKESKGALGGEGVAIAGFVLGIVGIAFFFLFVIPIMAAMFMPALGRARHEARKTACTSNVRQMGLVIMMYANDNRDMMPAGGTSGEIFRALERDGYLDNRNLLSCPANPIDNIDYNDPEGVSYYIDPDMPADRHPRRALYADRPPWDTNHNDGVNVLFEDGHVRFVRPEDSGPSDKISNPYIEEDTDIYADTGDPYKHAWIRWEKDTD